ncbi:MAG: replication initiator protein [Microvirus sp.]|nr:MAG: replication initiator protein [Microvirus sp.]
MACFHPLTAFQADTGEILFCERGSIRRELRLPCGKCVGCRLDRSYMWALRCMHEAQLYDRSLFVTLTYDDEHVPRSLRYADFQLFMKRLRKQVGAVRFYMAGEYGSRLWRPHFHALLFGCSFSDGELISEGGGNKLYVSATLSRIWGKGFVSFGEVTYDSARYVAGYCMKKVTGEPAKAHYTRLDEKTGELFEIEPEFSRMSLRPGIGAKWFDQYYRDVYGDGRDAVIRKGGSKMKPPKFYDKLLRQKDGFLADHIEGLRGVRTPEQVAEMEESRLAVREKVRVAGLTFNKREGIE